MKEITERRLTVEKRKDINEEFYENCNKKNETKSVGRN